MIQCCPPKSNNHPQCYPILIPPDDPFYGEWEEDCLNFVRTAMCSQCKLGKFWIEHYLSYDAIFLFRILIANIPLWIGPREQVNQITAYIDNSHIYGSAENETRSLWTKTGPAGRMHVSLATNGGELLPHSPEPTKDQCSKPDEGLYCFKAGTETVFSLPLSRFRMTQFLRKSLFPFSNLYLFHLSFSFPSI